MGVLREAALTLRPPAEDRHGPLMPMMLVLTVVTGVVDAASYLRLGHVFVANMTGNIVFLGFALAGAQGLSAITSLIALAAFLLGAAGGGRLGARSGEHRGHLLRAGSAAQSILLVVALAVGVAVSEPLSSGARYALILGDDEIAAGEYSLKDMQSGDQRRVSREQLFQSIGDRN